MTPNRVTMATGPTSQAATATAAATSHSTSCRLVREMALMAPSEAQQRITAKTVSKEANSTAAADLNISLYLSRHGRFAPALSHRLTPALALFPAPLFGRRRMSEGVYHSPDPPVEERSDSRQDWHAERAVRGHAPPYL